MKKENEHKKSFISFLKIKGIFLCIIIGLVLVVPLFLWLVTLPYRVNSILGFGNWNIVIGGFILFVLVNVPLMIISVLLTLDEDDIISIEILILIACSFITLVTYFWVKQIPYS